MFVVTVVAGGGRVPCRDDAVRVLRHDRIAGIAQRDGKLLRLLCLARLGYVHQHQHAPRRLPIGFAGRMNVYCITTAAVPVVYFLRGGAARLQRFAGQHSQVRQFDLRTEVAEGPADVAVDEVEQLLRRRGETADLQALVENDDRKADAEQQAVEVFDGAGQFLNAVLQFPVDCGEFFIGALQCGARRLHRLSGAMQFFVGRLDLLVGRLQLFLGGVALFDHGLLIFGVRREFAFQRLGARDGAGGVGLCAAGDGTLLGQLSEDHREVAAVAVAHEGQDFYDAGAGGPALAEPRLCPLATAVVLQRAVESETQFGDELLSHQPQEVEARAAGLGVEVAGVAAEKQLHIQLLVDDCAGRRELALYELLLTTLEGALLWWIDRSRRRRTDRCSAARHDAAQVIVRADGKVFLAIQFVFAVDGNEQIGVVASAFRRAEQQGAVGLQRVMKDSQQTCLHFLLEIDQYIPTTDEIKIREWRVFQQILRRENAEFAQAFGNQVAIVGFGKEAFQALGRQLGADVLGEETAAGYFDGVGIAVGAEDLHRDAVDALSQHLGQHDSDGIDFFAGRAAGHPASDRLVLALGQHQRCQHLLPNSLEGLAVAEKFGDADQQVAEQRVHFIGAVFEMVHILAEVVDVLEQHAALNTPLHGAALVTAEVVAAALLQQDEYFLEGVVVAVARPAGADSGTVREMGQLRGDIGRHQYLVDPAGGDGRDGHAIGLRCGGILHQSDAARALDGPEPEHAITAGAGQQHPYCVLFLIPRQTLKKTVNGKMRVPRSARAQSENALLQLQLAIGGKDMDVAGLQAQPVADLQHRYDGSFGQQGRESAVMLLRERLNYYPHRRRDGRRPRPYQFVDGRRPDSRRADGDDWEWLIRLRHALSSPATAS